MSTTVGMRKADHAAKDHSVVSAEHLKAFVSRARDDEAVKEAMKIAGSPDDIVALGHDHGFRFSVRDLDETFLELPSEDATKLAVRRAGFRVSPFGTKHWFGWK